MKKQNTGGWVRAVLALVSFTTLLTLAAPAASVPVSVHLEGAFSSTGIPRTLPFQLSSRAQSLFLRFHVPDSPLISSINSMSVTLTLHDDQPDPQSEGAVFFIALPGFPDLLLDFTDAGDLHGTTVGSPFVYNRSLTADEIDEFLALGALDNERFRVGVSRCCGDFVVTGGSVAIDANLFGVDEPGPLALLAAGALFALRRMDRSA